MKFWIAAALVLCAGAAFAQTQPAPGQFLRASDANHDGAVTRPEFDAVRAARFAQLDANHDGAIAVAELPSGMTAGKNGLPAADANGVISRAAFDQQTDRIFQHLDVNHDGRVTQAEVDSVHPGEPGH